MIRDVAVLVAAFAVTTLIALAVGAHNTGTAMAFGQIAFAAALLVVILRRP